jgi:hypothetical protein
LQRGKAAERRRRRHAELMKKCEARAHVTVSAGRLSRTDGRTVVMVMKGRCLCSDIAYEFDGDPLWIAHCHCESCRRATSSAFATYVGVKLAQFRYLKGEPTAYASSPGVQRYFCGRCGSPLAYVGARWPGEVHLYAGSLEQPAAIAPRGHVHVGEALPWADLHDDLPRYEKTSAGAKPLRRGPTAAVGKRSAKQ